MSSSYRRSIYLAGLTVTALLASIVGMLLYTEAQQLQGLYEHQAEQRAEHYRERAHVARERCGRIVPASEKADCVREERDAARQGEREAYDLQAQLVTSAWTRAMGIAAIIGMAVGIVGVGLVLITFRETRKAAEAAREANKIARDSTERQLRAYITIEEVEVRDFLPGGFPVYSCMLKNAGQTPALDVRSLNVVRGSDVGPDHKRIHFGKRGFVGSSPLGPGQSVPHKNPADAGLTKEAWQSVASGDKVAVFAGVVSYRDVFGKLHRTTFRHHLDGSKELNTGTGFAGLFPCTKGGRCN
jgi:ElaB/YqjD/DUF883 family membrane-anchored ribosome-binding protein